MRQLGILELFMDEVSRQIPAADFDLRLRWNKAAPLIHGDLARLNTHQGDTGFLRYATVGLFLDQVPPTMKVLGVRNPDLIDDEITSLVKAVADTMPTKDGVVDRRYVSPTIT